MGAALEQVASMEPKYSVQELGSYDKERHVRIDYARQLVSQEGLSPDRLAAAIDKGEIRVYDFNGIQYIDRLDVGRVYHQPTERRGLRIDRYFTRDLPTESDPLDSVDYEKRNIQMKDVNGKVIFEMSDAEFPKEWDDVSAQIVAEKYFFKPEKKEWREKLKARIGREYEHSPADLINRVTNFIANEGWKLGYFATETDMDAFADELKWLQIHRRFAFNSPVQFNAGIFNEYGVSGSHGLGFWRNPETGKIEKVVYGEYVHPQSHACFIAGPQDNLESILDHVKDEGSVFSLGSGIGQDIGALRAEGEPLSGGGKSSGPLSFWKIYDDAAGTIKSAGKSRRAARMTTMRYTHPDIMKFIESKVGEEIKSRHLQEDGYSGGMDGEAVRTVTFQNTNISVRLDDYFFEQLEKRGNVELRFVGSDDIAGEVPAEEMLKAIAFGSWRVGDPAVQYESKIQEYHTAPNSGRQNSTNPCSEYLFIDDTSCNLNSHNLVMYADSKGNLDIAALERGFWLTSVAADILNDASSYPIKNVAIISPEFRTIGVGYAGLGALLMRRGIAYDSDEGRATAAAISALMTGTVYKASAEMAQHLGPFIHFEFNKRSMLEVMGKHKNNLEDILWENVPEELKDAAYKSWEEAISLGEISGFRNAQATVVAPTGTISFLMGCQDSTGLEPGYALAMQKNLAGGGRVSIVNKEVPNSLRNLGYNDDQIKDIVDYISQNNKVIGSPHMNPDHYRVFETAVGDDHGHGTIPFEGHIKMLGAVQPFISGSMSKTCNLPETATVKDIYEGYLLGHDLGVKALAVFRKNSKTNNALGQDKSFRKLRRGEKEEPPFSGNAFRQEVKIDNTPFLITIGEYDDGRPGEVVINSFTSDSTLGALLRVAGIDASTSLKRGLSLEDTVKGWGHGFEPHGFVRVEDKEGKIIPHPYIKDVTSPLDFVRRLVLLHYKGQVDVATEPKEVKIEDLRGFKNGAFRTYERMSFDEWDRSQVLNDPELGGFVEKKPGQSLMIAKHNGNNNGNNRGVTCHKCGNLTIQTAPGCFKCGTCGESVGGCGI